MYHISLCKAFTKIFRKKIDFQNYAFIFYRLSEIFVTFRVLIF